MLECGIPEAAHMNEDIQPEGLNTVEVLLRRKQYGMNTPVTGKTGRLRAILREVLGGPLVIILLLATLVYFLLGEPQEGIIMIVALGLVSGISVYQENRSRNAVESLRKLTAPFAKVLRDGRWKEIPSEEIVPGDVILLEYGMLVPADAKIVSCHDFAVDESLLSGESAAVYKSAQTPDDAVYQGTMVTSGSCIAAVTATGRRTRLGNIGRSMQEVHTGKTPLQLQISHFIRAMVIAGAGAFLVVWGINYYRTGNFLEGLLRGLTLAMSALPEELPVAFSTFMAMGSFYLYKEKVIVRSPLTVETLGAATVICTDKTGTLTENRMQLSAVFDFTSNKTVTYDGAKAPFTPALEYGMWASEPEPFEPMERSLHRQYTEDAPDDRRAMFRFVHEYPLSGLPPVMTHVFENDRGERIIAAKGGLETILRQCDLPEAEQAGIRERARTFAAAGNRVLAVAKSNLQGELPEKQSAFALEFLGLLAFYDPPKKNIPAVIGKFYEAGIQVKMVTGDFAETTLAVAGQCGIRNNGRVITGDEVMHMTETELAHAAREVSLFARMYPEAKLRLVETLRRAGEVVAMTGDGVNDGPALKAAHIGIAMGLRGSEVAKNAASLVLADDELAHMTDAIAAGRRIYENLKKAFRYIISIHIPIILIVTLPLLMGWRFTDIFSPVHVIFLELIMGPTCSIIFEREPMEKDAMHRPPRPRTRNLFSLRELSLSIVQGFVITAVCLGLGYLFMVRNSPEDLTRTLIYTTLVFSNIFLTLVNRSFTQSLFVTLRNQNMLIPLMFLFSLAVLFASLYIPPVREIFRFTDPGFMHILLCLALAAGAVLWVEGWKFFRRHLH